MNEDIYKVSIPLTLGVLCSFLILRFCNMPVFFPYWSAALVPLGLVAFFPSARRSRIRILWLGTFFLIGVLLHSLGSINSAWTFSRTERSGIIGQMQKGLSHSISAIPFRDAENNALMEALLLGNKGALSRATISAFRTAGAAHLLALSGMHLGIIYAAVGKALQLLLGNTLPMRRIRRIAIILICLWYTILCGAGDSLLRAWLFILLREVSLLLDRPQPPGQILCAALTIHLVLRPTAIESIGFQLSYLAMVGIVFVWPHVKDWVCSKIWQGASLSICCQLFTAPLTLLYFGTFPKYFLITNLLASPLLSVVLVCCIVLLTLQALCSGAFLSKAAVILEIPITLLRALLGAISEL